MSERRYILRKPVEAKQGQSMRHGDIFVLAPDADGYSQVETNLFYELFEPVDIETKRQQIREQILNAFKAGLTTGSKETGFFAVDELLEMYVDAVLGVVGLTKGQNDG